MHLGVAGDGASRVRGKRRSRGVGRRGVRDGDRQGVRGESVWCGLLLQRRVELLSNRCRDSNLRPRALLLPRCGYCQRDDWSLLLVKMLQRQLSAMELLLRRSGLGDGQHWHSRAPRQLLEAGRPRLLHLPFRFPPVILVPLLPLREGLTPIAAASRDPYRVPSQLPLGHRHHHLPLLPGGLHEERLSLLHPIRHRDVEDGGFGTLLRQGDVNKLPGCRRKRRPHLHHPVPRNPGAEQLPCRDACRDLDLEERWGHPP
mmetsp:Transcript_11420/g.29685  ORF Transcript_11420/g.29685 Transcript_11420/m.29685 type:complete len:258 (-) Transcript_11420:39-812(-)